MVKLRILVFWIVIQCRLYIDTNGLEKHAASIFRAEDARIPNETKFVGNRPSFVLQQNNSFLWQCVTSNLRECQIRSNHSSYSYETDGM
jgi:hypothetical protein